MRGDLASGSVTHKLGADGPTLVVNYWTTQNVGTWTTRVSAPIQLSAHLEDVHNRDQARVSRFRASLTTDASANATVLVDDAGSFVITPPYSYGSAFVLPAQPTQAHNATVTVEFDLLIETAPSSHQYYRQTVLDTLNFTFVPANQELLND